RSFLALHPPFDALEDQQLDQVVACARLEHFSRGAVILQQAGALATHLYVVRSGAVEIIDEGRGIDEAGEGEVFGMWSLLGHVAPNASVRAAEETSCYLIDADVASSVLQTGAGMAFVAASAVDGSRGSLRVCAPTSIPVRSVRSDRSCTVRP
ncbi:MAG: cyclic nucleotide-binding domain-containing protein, partial [Actinomycetota bacterium]